MFLKMPSVRTKHNTQRKSRIALSKETQNLLKDTVRKKKKKTHHKTTGRQHMKTVFTQNEEVPFNCCHSQNWQSLTNDKILHQNGSCKTAKST